ncbi:MAG TPA: hypothetical protein VEI24_00600, partial [Nitrospiria bacterium]|nr:hypothetical protein [Nitrospiria bacterium]
MAWLPTATTAWAADPIVELRSIQPESTSPGGTTPAAPSTRLVIDGTVAGDDFASAVIEYGRGETPSQWVPIATLKHPVSNGRLAVWETKALPADHYAVRVTVYTAAGLFRRTQQQVDLTSWRPDLIIRQVMSRLDGATLTVAVDIANQGRQPAPGPVTMIVGVLRDPPTDSASL